MVDLKENIRKFVLSAFPMARKGQISIEDSLLETGIIDSLGVLEIVNYLIEELGVEVDEEDLTPENFENVMSIVKLVERKKDACCPGVADTESEGNRIDETRSIKRCAANSNG